MSPTSVWIRPHLSLKRTAAIIALVAIFSPFIGLSDQSVWAESDIVPTKTSEGLKNLPLVVEEDELYLRLQGLSWQAPKAETHRLLSLTDLLQEISQRSPELQLAQEVIKEEEIRAESVNNKRVFFFFKVLNAKYLETAAETDLLATRARFQRQRADYFLEASEAYYQLVKAYLQQYVHFQTIQQGLGQLESGYSQFQSGEANRFDLLQTQAKLLTLYDDYLRANSQLETISESLSQQLSLPVLELNLPKVSEATLEESSASEAAPSMEVLEALFPKALDLSVGAPQVELLTLIPENYTLDQSIEEALKKRADLTELHFRIESIENLVKASAYDFDKNQKKLLTSTVKQLQWKEESLKQDIQRSLRTTYKDYRLIQQRLNSAQLRLDLAETAFLQTEVSAEAGFSSENDLLDARVALAQSQVAYLNTLVDLNLAQLKLLYETGQFESVFQLAS